MQFTSPIIVALLLAVSTTTVTAAQTISNLRSGRKLQDETELNLLRELGGCWLNGPPITIQSGDTCGAIHNTCDGDWASLECGQAGKTCTKENSKLIAGDSCTLSNGCKIDESGFPDAKAPTGDFCGGPGGTCADGYTCCTHPGDAKHPDYTYYCH